ncbi:transforming growth factor-beta receptor type 3-like protein [Hyperolius riggenbachi]|uniref:transforming growth factor-beta receptor type 3-like protein n=1 Tax=Hyperolius riggenbachi TaxID=752182 RepID=UPI0035A34BDE
MVLLPNCDPIICRPQQKSHHTRPSFSGSSCPVLGSLASCVDLCTDRMQLLIIMALCLGTLKGPPSVLSFDISKLLYLRRLSQAATSEPASALCQNSREDMTATLQGSECSSALLSEGGLMDSTVVQLLVRGPEKQQCEHGTMCSMKVESRIQAEVFLSAAPASLGLSLALCSLSASSNPFSQSHVPLLVNDCPAAAGVSLLSVPPKPCIKTPPTKSFSFQLGPFFNNSIQFLHCRVELCLQEKQCISSAELPQIPKCRAPGVSCSPLSTPSSFLKPVFQRTVTQPLLVTISAPSRPPLPSISEQKKFPLPPRQEYPVQGVGTVAVVVVTLCSFFLGVMLTVGLWCIHNKTAPDDPVTRSA